MRAGKLVALLCATPMMMAACGGGGDTEDDIILDGLPEAPTDGARLVTPTFKVAPGQEVFECMRIPYEVKEDMYVNRSVAFQATGGHHSMLYYSEQTPTGGDAPHECDDGDMGNIRFIGVGTNDGVGITLPDGIALKIPKGSKIYTQSHYLNASDEEVTAQDVVDLHLIPFAELTNVAGAFTEVDLGLELPAGQDTTRVIDCTAPMAMTVPWAIPHMHELGATFKLEIIRDGVSTTVYDTTWSETLRDHFPLVQFDPHLQLTPEDHVRTTCVWHNDTDTTRLFPNEMCATFMPFYPSPNGALLACDENGNHFEP